MSGDNHMEVGADENRVRAEFVEPGAISAVDIVDHGAVARGAGQRDQAHAQSAQRRPRVGRDRRESVRRTGDHRAGAAERVGRRAPRSFTLRSGGLLATGTPSGVGYARTPAWLLQPGDTVEVEVERLGILRNTIVGNEGRTADR
ncbi:fumarylacetoacetate hydrolase family protein [Nocardia beijingensis]